MTITRSGVCYDVGTQMLKDVVEHCRACSKTEDSYQGFKKYILTSNASSPSRTLYVLEVLYIIMHAGVILKWGLL